MLSDDKLCVDKLYVSKLCVDKLCDEKWCVDKLCGDKLSDDKFCVDKLCEDKLCVDKLRGRTGGGRRRDTNQKQEPHTKMCHIIKQSPGLCNVKSPLITITLW